MLVVQFLVELMFEEGAFEKSAFEEDGLMGIVATLDDEVLQECLEGEGGKKDIGLGILMHRWVSGEEDFESVDDRLGGDWDGAGELGWLFKN